MKKILLLLVSSLFLSACNVSFSTKKTSAPPKDAVVQNGPFNYQPEGNAAKTKVPAFTITAPSGWVKTSSSGKELVHFESTQLDSEKVDGGSVTTNAIINVKATDTYTDLSDFANQYKASGDKVKGSRLVNSQSISNGQSLEFTYPKEVAGKTITVHELAHLYFKNGISFLVKGYSSDSVWSKHASTIQSSLSSFKFN